VKLSLILGLASVSWAVEPAALPEAVAGAKTVFLRNDTTEYKTFDFLNDKLRDFGRWGFATKPQYADIVLVFDIKSETLGTQTTKPGGAMAIGGGAYASGSTVTTDYVVSQSTLRVEDSAGHELMIFACPRDHWNTPERTASNLIKQFEERFPKSQRR
jgi:hypothetical protein